MPRRRRAGRAGCVWSIFLPLEAACLDANLTKIDHGGWLPLAIGVGLYGLVMTWSRGRAIVVANRVREEGPLRPFVEQLYPNVEHNHVLHEQVVILTARSAKVPRVHPQDRITVDVLGYTDDISHVTPRFGFQEDPDIPDAFRPAGAKGVECDIDFEGATYFLSWATVRVTDATGMDRWRKRLSVAIWRDSANPVEYLRLPDRRAITIGWRVPL